MPAIRAGDEEEDEEDEEDVMRIVFAYPGVNVLVGSDADPERLESSAGKERVDNSDSCVASTESRAFSYMASSFIMFRISGTSDSLAKRIV